MGLPQSIIFDVIELQQFFTFNFRNLIVTSTGFTKEQKTELQVKVERMGGIYSNAFHDGVTHIICSLVRFVIRSIFHMKVINKVLKFSVDFLPTFLAVFKLVIDQSCSNNQSQGRWNKPDWPDCGLA